MSITLYPYKLTLKEMEARLERGVMVLPGQLIRFYGQSPAYGEVTGVRSLPASADTGPTDVNSGGCLVRIRLLHGYPTLTPQGITLLSDEQMAQEVQRLLEPFEHPLHFDDRFTSEFERLGALTVIVGDDFVLKYDALMMLVSAIGPYQRLLLIDPLGLFSAEDKLSYHRAGQDIRLSMQQVGGKRFLNAIGETFPDNLRDEALRALADRLPSSPGFTGFHQLLNADGPDFPLKPLVLQSLQVAGDAQVFADTPDQVLSLRRIAADDVNAIDLSGLSEPWKSLFYEEICHELYRNVGGDVVPVLIYPENYLPDLESWIQKADEAELNLVILASPYAPELLEIMANNLFILESRERAYLSGELTKNLPVRFRLPESEPAETEGGEGASVPAASMETSEAYAQASSQEAAPVRPMQIVDLKSPPAEQRVPLSGPVSADMPLTQVELEPEPQPLSPDELMALMAGFPNSTDLPEKEETPPPAALTPPVAEAAPADLNYPDADEGGMSPEPQVVVPEAAEAPLHEAAPTSSPDYAFPAPEGFDPAGSSAPEEFSFDVNLDQKIADGWGENEPAPELEPVAPQTVNPAVSQSLQGFEEIPVAPVVSLAADSSESVSTEPVLAGANPQEDAAEAPVREVIEDDMVPPIISRQTVEGLNNGNGFKSGDRVRHETYGLGIVNKVVPMEQDVILNITFESVGKRLLDPTRCRLTKEIG